MRTGKLFGPRKNGAVVVEAPRPIKDIRCCGVTCCGRTNIPKGP